MRAEENVKNVSEESSSSSDEGKDSHFFCARQKDYS